MNYHNPVRALQVDDWPHGRDRRCVALFQIDEHPKRGERIKRTTILDGKAAKPKTTTYAVRCAIVTGDDGRTYLLHDYLGHVSVMQGDMKYQAESLFPNDPGYARAVALLDTAAALKA